VNLTINIDFTHTHTQTPYRSADAVISEANELRNTLESYALETRSAIRGELADFIAQSDAGKW
jgi:hypothetical protein